MGTVVVTPTLPLAQLLPGQQAIVQRVNDDDPELLRYLTSLGLVPGVMLCMESVAPYGGVCTVCIGTTVHAIGDAVTRHVLVRPIADETTGRTMSATSGGELNEDLSSTTDGGCES